MDLQIIAFLVSGAFFCGLICLLDPQLTTVRKRRFSTDDPTRITRGLIGYEKWAKKTKQKLRLAGIEKTPKKVLQERVGVTVIGFLIGTLFLNNLVAGILLGTFGLSWVRDRLEQKIRQQREIMIEVAASTVQLMHSAWETYHQVIKVIETAIPQMPYPVDEAFSKLLQSHNLNRPSEQALNEYKEMVPNKYLCFLAHILWTNLTTGGDIAEAIKRISLDLRREKQEIMQLREDTAGAAFTSNILFSIPSITYGLYWVIDPSAVVILTDNLAGQIIIDVIIVLCMGTWFRLKSIYRHEV